MPPVSVLSSFRPDFWPRNADLFFMLTSVIPQWLLSAWEQFSLSVLYLSSLPPLFVLEKSLIFSTPPAMCAAFSWRAHTHFWHSLPHLLSFICPDSLHPLYNPFFSVRSRPVGNAAGSLCFWPIPPILLSSAPLTTSFSVTIIPTKLSGIAS